MSTNLQPATNPKWMFWVGWVLTILPVPLLLMSAYFKISKAPAAVEGFQKMNFPLDILVPLGFVELTCTILYLIPQTAMLGAILLAGYLGGAVCTHINAAEYSHAIIPFAMGVVLWLGLFFRDSRVRQLAPLRTLN
jgi:DoxX-like family